MGLVIKVANVGKAYCLFSFLSVEIRNSTLNNSYVCFEKWFLNVMPWEKSVQQCLLCYGSVLRGFLYCTGMTNSSRLLAWNLAISVKCLSQNCKRLFLLKSGLSSKSRKGRRCHMSSIPNFKKECMLKADSFSLYERPHAPAEVVARY